MGRQQQLYRLNKQRQDEVRNGVRSVIRSGLDYLTLRKTILEKFEVNTLSSFYEYDEARK